MDVQKAISSTGELLFEFAVSLILIPRTLLKILHNPSWIIDYLSSASSENSKERFDKYSHPILFWIVTGILPYYFIIDFCFFNYSDGEILSTYIKIGDVRIIMSLSIFLVSFPISCAFILQLFKYKCFTRPLFKKSFYTQLYLTAPVQLFYIPLFFIDNFSDSWVLFLSCIGIGIVFWFLIAEFIVIRKELDCGWVAGISILILMYLIFYVFAAICLLIFFLVNVGVFKSLIDSFFNS